MNLNYSSNDHAQYHHHPFLPNPSFFFDSSQDHSRFYDQYRPNHVPDDQNYGATYEIKNKVDGGLSFTLWKKEDDHEHHSNHNPMKWMSSKMRLMQKMKTVDHDHMETSNADDQKLQPSSSSAETDLSSNSSSYNNSPIRVCSDCNTTKTPLWRSGPKGPKSLCNACGIRQRKARRAMAAAAAANGASANTASDHPTTTKIKLQHKGKMSGKTGHASQLKKRCKTAASAAAVAPSNDTKKLGFEDFLINLSKNLAFHRVFPDDEKDAAILLMALSSGLVNG